MSWSFSEDDAWWANTFAAVGQFIPFDFFMRFMHEHKPSDFESGEDFMAAVKAAWDDQR